MKTFSQALFYASAAEVWQQCGRAGKDCCRKEASSRYYRLVMLCVCMQLSHEVYYGITYLYAHSEYMRKEDFLDSNCWGILAVNNAGTINKNNKTWNVSAEDFDMVVDTNIKGTANVLRHFVPLMIEKRHGIIINLSSAWGRSVAAEVIQKTIKCIIVVSFWWIKILNAY